MPPIILVLNAGSSSLKFAVHAVGERRPLLSGLAERLGPGPARIAFRDAEGREEQALEAPTHAAALDAVLAALAARGLLPALAAVGHRVVHGGESFAASARITPEALAAIEACSALAPLHNPPAVLGIRVALDRLPGLVHVAVPDTAFHQTMPKPAYLYALPMALYREHGLRRYGFHGTSHRFVAGEAVRLAGLDPADHGLVIAHLGNGASATAVQDGRSLDTTMGLTPLEGLVMGTRSGDVDPGALPFVASRLGLDLAGLDALLNKRSGLLGLSELSNDMRELEAAADAGHEGARMAIEVFVHRLARHVGGLATSLRRFDALVFTGGIGENSARIRAMTLRRLAVFGLSLDEAANGRMLRGEAGRIGGPAAGGAGPLALVVPTDEEWMIACDAAALAGLARGDEA